MFVCLCVCVMDRSDVYHLAFMRPESEKVIRRLQPPKELLSKEQVAKKLLLYHREAHGLLRTYGSWLHFINADQPHMDVSAQGGTHSYTHQDKTS